MDRAEILEKYRNILGEDSVKARRLIQKLDYKNDPILLQHIAQTYLDEARFEADGTPINFLKSDDASRNSLKRGLYKC